MAVPRDKGPPWWQDLRRQRWKGHLRQQWHAEVPLADLVAGTLPEVEEGRHGDTATRRRGDGDRLIPPRVPVSGCVPASSPSPRPLHSMAERFGHKTPLYRELSTAGAGWGTIVSAFWGAGIKLSNPEFWSRRYVEAAGPEHYRITRQGLRALWMS